MDELEEECANAVFEICDARERYPSLCTNELARCLKLESEICLMEVNASPVPEINTPQIPKNEAHILENFEIPMESDTTWVEREKKLHSLSNKMEDLRVIAEQIEREKQCNINKLLKNSTDF